MYDERFKNSRHTIFFSPLDVNSIKSYPEFPFPISTPLGGEIENVMMHIFLNPPSVDNVDTQIVTKII